MGATPWRVHDGRMMCDSRESGQKRDSEPIDATEQRASEEALAHRRLESMGYVTASTIHDFNNLLTPILCASTLLDLELEPGTRAHDMVTEIRDATERAAELVRQLMRFARRQPLAVHRVDVNLVIQELAPLMHRGLPEDVGLVLDLHGDHLDAVVDRGRLENALLNLVANARDAMPMGGNIVISSAASADRGDQSTEGFIVLRITDEGEGMSAEVHARLYERLFTTKAGRGTGLGLSAVRAFVVESGGHLSVYSELGRGTSVVIELPRAAASDKREPEGVGTRNLPRGTETILVVEDDESVRRTLASVLERYGYNVLVAPTGAHAVEVAAAAQRIDLVIVDVVMPKMSGRAVVDRLHRAGRHPKILFVSGHTKEIVEDRQGPSDDELLIRKPFSVEELLRNVRAALDGSA